MPGATIKLHFKSLIQPQKTRLSKNATTITSSSHECLLIVKSDHSLNSASTEACKGVAASRLPFSLLEDYELMFWFAQSKKNDIIN